jgi:hypothetical protein
VIDNMGMRKPCKKKGQIKFRTIYYFDGRVVEKSDPAFLLNKAPVFIG